MQKNHELFMERCLQLALLGQGNVSPNPMVGCVIVKDGKIIGEGYHQEYGEAHAEVNAIRSVADQSSLKSATLYVTLEPCSHWGKTPPCADLIIEKQIPRVYVGSIDTFDKVSGRGIHKLKMAGITVVTGILESLCREINARFYTFHERKRPYIILKWAQTQDGFIDIAPHMKTSSRGLWITNDVCKKLVHKWRSEEDSIMIGSHTACEDNPSLTTRCWIGKNPTRVVIDRHLSLDRSLSVFDGSVPTIVFTQARNANSHNTEFVALPLLNVSEMMTALHERDIQSIIIEGGSLLLQSFIDAKLWDEARVFTGPGYFIDGVIAPRLPAVASSQQVLGDSTLRTFFNDFLPQDPVDGIY